MSCRSINPCHVAIADARVMNSVMITHGTDVAAIADVQPKIMVTAIMAVVIIATVVIAIFIVPVTMITNVIKS